MKTLTQILIEEQSRHHSFSVSDSDLSNDIQRSWLDNQTTDAWRHNRMRSGIEALISFNDKWLTVGDCRFASDAVWLKRHGASVTASDIQDVSLKQARELDLIDEYKILNMESLNIEDDAYDYIFCKESLHHLSRPYLGIYEMIRCARKGVILIEPTGRSPLNVFGQLTLLVKNIISDRNIFFEESGNYVFELKKFDIEQILLSLGISRFSYRYLNDDYMEGVEKEYMGSIYKHIQKRILLKDLRDMLFQWTKGMIVVVIHANNVDSSSISVLHEFGFKTVTLPQSPLIENFSI
jgi:ubiquinone/menaquinone biosynthesis C-methylase UbiE